MEQFLIFAAALALWRVQLRRINFESKNKSKQVQWANMDLGEKTKN